MALAALLEFAVDPQEEADRKEGRLAVIADHLGFSWSELARELEFSEVQINQIRNENPNSLQDQSHALIRLWKEREAKNATAENTLMKTLTKINRMDIVHLIETKIIQSSQEQSSHTYAEIEQTISLDHSEGFSALQEDMDSPRPGRRAEATQKASELGPLVASVEDLSCNASSLDDTQKERLMTDKEMSSEVVGTSAPSSFDMVGLRQQFPGTLKRVSPFFTLYKAVPWRLQSQVYGPVCIGGTISNESSGKAHETVNDPLQELGATGGQFIPVFTQQDDEQNAPPVNSNEEYKLRQRQTTLSDFGHTLLESEHAEPDFNELSVELEQDSEDYITSPISSAIHFPTSPSNEKTEISSTSSNKYEVAFPKKPSQSEEYIQRHVEEVSDRFYRTLFGESYVLPELCEKNVNVETYSFPKIEISSVDEGNCNIIPVCVQESSDVSKDSDVIQFGITELSTERVQSITQIISSPLQKPSMSFALVSGTDITEKITPSTLNQMSLDSVTKQPHMLSLPITDSGSSETRVEVITETKPTDSECTKTESISLIPAEIVKCRPLTPISITSPVEPRSLSPDLEFEYFDNLGMISSEYRSSPESVDSLPLDSPIPFDYRPSSPDSCILMAELRVSSPESVASVNDYTLLSVDSPLPDFRPATPLPTFENYTPEFTIHVEEYKTLHAPGEITVPLTGYTEDSLGACYLEVTDDTQRPISPGSVIFFRSLSPESNGSWSPTSICSDILDSEHSTETSFDGPSPYAFLTELRPSSPESTASVNKNTVLPPDSPIPCFSTEVQNGSLSLMAGYRSPSLKSELSDIECDLISLECLPGSRPSSPESFASLTNQRCLSPDSPLPSFTQTMWESFIPTKLFRSDSFESGLSDNENKPISEVLTETRISSPESFTSINEHRPLSPDSPVPVYRSTSHFDVIQFWSQRDSSPELETSSDIEYSHCEPLICEPRSQSPESIILEPEYIPLSTVIVESVCFEGEPTEKTYTQKLAPKRVESLHNEEQSMSELPKPKDIFMSKTMFRNLVAKIFDPHFKGGSKLVVLDNTGTLHGQKMIYPPSTESVNYTVNKDLTQINLHFESQCNPLSSQHQFRPVSPEPLLLDDSLEQTECRPPESVSSVNESRPLSPVSPATEFSGFLRDCPDSILSDTDKRSLSPDSLPEWRPMSPDSVMYLKDIRGSSPKSNGSINEHRPLSPDSPITQYFPVVFESISVKTNRSSSTESELSMEEWELNDFTLDSSLESTKSINDETFDFRSLSPDSPISQYDVLHFEPTRATSYVSLSPESMLSDTDVQNDLFDDIVFDLRRSSAESITSLNENRPLSPDSPIPEFTIATQTFNISFTGSRSSSPESVTLNVKNELCQSDLYPDQRSDSPQSIISETEIGPLSPDSPVPQFMTLFPQSTLPVTRPRSWSTQSLYSENTECDPYIEDLLNIEYRPDSPDSILSETEKRPLSPDSLSEWRSMSPDSAMLLKDIRGSSPQSDGPMDDYRPLSPDSPVPQYFPALFELVSVTEYMSSSPESALSEDECELNILNIDSSPESINDERLDFRHLSPDSPISQYYTFQFEPTMFTSNLSPSPELVPSEIDMQSDVFDDLVIDIRRSSLESVTSLNENRPLSPDSPIPEFKVSTQTFLIALTGSRPTSPESVTLGVENELCPSDLYPGQRSDSPQSIISETEIRPLSPDSPVPQFMTLFPQSNMSVTRPRSCSPQSMCSDNTECEPYIEDLLTLQYRPDSPDSILSDTDKRPLSPDSLSEWRPMSPDSAMLLQDIRGSSPRSNGSTNEYRSLSPDSPIPQYFPALFESVSVTDYMSSPLEFALSDEECELNVFTQDSFSESAESINDERPDFRSLSPDSPIAQYYNFYFEPTMVTGYTSISPESVLSGIDMQTDVFDDLMIDLRRSSLESIASIDENREMPPDSPFPDFTLSTQSFIMPEIGSCPTSPELDYVDDENTLYQTDFISEQRSDSPQSIISETGGIPLSSDSPVPQFSVLFSQITLPAIGSGSCSPQSLCSGTIEDEPSFESLFIRGSSPQSVVSMNECRCPDSPIPHYSQLFIEPRPIKAHGSSSPESMTSDVGYELYELENSASECEYRLPLMDLVSESEHTSSEVKSHLAYFRASSTDSDTLVNDIKLLSPDSPVPQYFPALIKSVPDYRYLSDYMSSSPESLLSEEELNVLTEASPEYINEGRSLSPDSPIAMTDSPILQYYASNFEPTLVTGYRSTSNQTILSEKEMQTDEVDDLLMDLRTSSPESVALVTENRPLSPDSPIPEFTQSIYTFSIPESDSISISPVSLSDENELYPSDFSMGQRPNSPESVISETEPRPASPESLSDYSQMSHNTTRSVVDCASPEFFKSLEECRILSPDSVPQFKISAINVQRSESSESLTLETDIELWVTASQATEERPSSPESIISLNEKRPLSPDSPIYDFKSLLHVNITPKTTYRSSSLESVVSDLEFDMESFASDDVTWTENRPLSPASGEISPVDQCHLGQDLSNIVTYLPLNMTFRMMPQYKLVYKAVPLALISHLYDPHYKGETFCPKPGVFEYTGCKKANNEFTEQHNYDISNNAISHIETSSPFDTSSLQTYVQTESFDLFGTNQAFSNNPLIYCTRLNACLIDSSDSRASSPESYTSINEYRQLSPESPIPEHRPTLPWAEFLFESRPSSPDTIFSVNEFQSLSPDSPIPEYSTSSPVPNAHTSESSEVFMQHKFILSPLSPSINNDQSSDKDSYPESYSSWYPLPQWIMSENRPSSSLSDISDTDSRSLSPQMFCIETNVRNPSPEAATLDTELTETITPEPLICETFYEPESVISESEDEFYDNLNDLSLSDIDEIKKDLPVFKNDPALLNPVTFEQCVEQIESPYEIEEPVSEIRIECSFDDGLQPKAFHDIASEQTQKDTPSAAKTITYCEEQDVIATSESANEETSKGHNIHDIDEKRHMESLQQQKEDVGHDLRKLAPRDDKKRDSVSEEINLMPQVKDSSLRKGDTPSISKSLNLTESFITNESSKDIATHVSNIPERNRSQPVFDLEAHKSTPGSSPEETKALKGLEEVNSFQFHLKDSHRRVKLNRIDSSAFSLGLESSDCKNLPSMSVKTPSTDTSLSRIFNTSSSEQGNSPECQEFLGKEIPCAAGTVQLSSEFKHVVSKFEQASPSLGGDKPELSLVFPGTYPLVAAMSPCTLEVTQDMTGDQMHLGATAVLDVDFPLYSLNFKARPRPAHADSIESEAEFFDCRQTFSDASEQEEGSLEILDVPQTVYHVEELPSLSSSPEYLTGISKLREHTQLKKDERPLSWASEDLPIVLEPEDEYTCEVGEGKDFPYDYTGGHSFAEELPPIEGAEYDDDDDSLGREIAEELGLLSDSSEEEVLTTRVVRRRVVIQGDEMPEIPPQTVTEEKYTDEYGNIVVKKITRKVIRKYVSADGVEREEVMLEGPQQEAVSVDEADGFSKVVKRTVVRSGGDHTEVTFSEPLSYVGATSSEFEEEPVQGRKVSKVIKTMVVQGERMEKLIGDPSLSSDLPSAKEDFEKDPDA
ncbi:uncharacterized protein LOC122347998 [Puntigrus tetrazona]|uniref:uncharacterized protein LOC122347998 n=1 Tax=Puntigrus tetrazona TaxID=1606681 RepID=UPI001C8A790C|nr:uncharacterized protein LOC122347998 [Puntigrus tetrazona]